MKSTAKKNVNLKWYQTRKGAAAIALLSLAAVYVLASLAIDSGSLLEYLAAIGLLILAVNRLSHVVLASFGKAEG